MTVLGLDVGERRIGVAISGGFIASPLTTVMRGSDKAAVASIGAIAAEHGAEMMVVGVPYGPQGEMTEQARRVQAFGGKLRAIPGVRVVFWDERFTTRTASEAMLAIRPKRQGPPTPRQREAHRRRLDAAAAAVILQDYLDAQGRQERQQGREVGQPGPPAES
jgi:putative holliday junction resolvase